MWDVEAANNHDATTPTTTTPNWDVDLRELL